MVESDAGPRSVACDLALIAAGDGEVIGTTCLNWAGIEAGIEHVHVLL